MNALSNQNTMGFGVICDNATFGRFEEFGDSKYLLHSFAGVYGCGFNLKHFPIF